MQKGDRVVYYNDQPLVENGSVGTIVTENGDSALFPYRVSFDGLVGNPLCHENELTLLGDTLEEGDYLQYSIRPGEICDTVFEFVSYTEWHNEKWINVFYPEHSDGTKASGLIHSENVRAILPREDTTEPPKLYRYVCRYNHSNEFWLTGAHYPDLEAVTEIVGHHSEIIAPYEPSAR